MTQSEFLKAFKSLALSLDRVHASFGQVSICLAEKLRILSGPLPFTIRDEIELNRKTLDNVDASISLISALQKVDLIGRLELPLGHNLLRLYRNENHHVGYVPFKPVLCSGKIDFYVWASLYHLASVKAEHSEWTQTPTALTLMKLLHDNHEYILGISEEAEKRLSSSGYSGLFVSDYTVGELALGKDDLDSWTRV